MKTRLIISIFTVMLATTLSSVCYASETGIHSDLQAALDSANQAGKILLVDFYGGWCPWCVKMDETLADSSVKSLIDQKFYYYKLDVGQFDQHTGCLEKYGVEGIPYIIVFNRDGSVKDTCDGYKDADSFRAFLEKIAGASKASTSIHPDLEAALKSANTAGKILLVDFYGSWCPWCVKMDETLADSSVKAIMDEKFYYYKLDVGQFDQHKGCIEKYGVEGIPFIIAFDSDGSVKTTCDGYKDVDGFKAFLNEASHNGFQVYSFDKDATPDPVRASVEKAKNCNRLLVVTFCDDSTSKQIIQLFSDADSDSVAGNYAVLPIDQAANETLAAHYGCSKAPFIIIFKKDGSVATFFTELVTAEKFKTALRESLNK